MRIKIKDLPEDMGTRSSGHAFREFLLKEMEASDEPIVLDFDGVWLMYSKFVDATIVQLLVDKGEEYVKAHLDFEEVSPYVYMTIRRCIYERFGYPD